MRQVRNGSMPVFFAVGLITLSAVASEITWHGGGGSLAWNDGTNWEGGEAPGEGDSATIPEGLEAVATTGTDVALMNTLSRIEISSGATLCISNLGETSTLTVPLIGSGRLYICDQPNTTARNYLTLAGDNSAFTGVFAITNAGLMADSENCFGGQNGGPISVKLNGSQRFMLNKAVTYYNNLEIGANNYSTALFIAYLNGTVWAGDIAIASTLQINGNNASFRLNGSLTRKADCTVSFANNVILAGVTDLGSSYTKNVYTSGTVILDGGNGNIKSLGHLYASGRVKCAAKNVFDPSYGYWFCLGNSARCLFDINGWDQQVAQLAQQAQYTQVTSGVPATVKILKNIRNDRQAYFWNGGGVDSICGRASIDLESTSDFAVANTKAIFTNMNCTTAGGLSCGRGTMTIAGGTTTFSNLTTLAAYGTGTLEVETAHVNPEAGLAAVAVTNTAKMTFKDGITQKTLDAYLASGARLKIGSDGWLKVSHRTYLDGRELAAGIYGKVGGTYANGSEIPAKFQLSCLSGDGWLETNGPQGLIVSFH